MAAAPRPADTLKPIVIAGGGLVGALTALLVARQRPDWIVTVLEPQASGPAQDKRTIALAAATIDVLQQLQVWPEVASAACAIEHIHVSDRGHLGMTQLHAEQQGVPALGYVIAAAQLNQALYQACLAQPNIEWLAGAWFSHSQPEQDSIAVHYQVADQPHVCHAQLLVGADGSRSQVRSSAGIQMQQTDYQQVGIIAMLELSEPMQGWAYERFTDTGPLALLPVSDQVASLVWSLRPAEAEQMMAASDDEFMAKCQQAFGYRAGRLRKVWDRVQYPLQLHLAEQHIAQRLVLIGNASHTLHPIAGQGFNLGVRDAISLSQQLATAADAGQYRVLASYQRERQSDYKAIIGLTDSLVRGFSNQLLPLVIGRNIALSALAWLLPLKQQFARKTMGYRN
ncbi:MULTISPECIES: 2-octaprenyl-6-methoxyphenyl hydroxylase [Idiomarina]|uniref:2-octaprenyl-6-methoxyphenyl hydroxylase n=1 Tax=Idiomarina TaxID=135575 RepID=UPI00129B3080|nr:MULTISPECIES: 2-octaprenyl-6-methoxyphenyl hydroxylase [Idiomarina]MRJ41541.1 2-octaprenyl-6-methoxyphenyl hydroxylase [Idiomarina sp. FeN1]NCU57531.1 2-octaprenyl-6-methoxyphenyl hydroxylase [Idiomarina sp. FenA--70]NCU60083.1 2-octaprenyl-6-methoxyphenyl hydroxylase [Idiomarina sp. FenBw--71]UUN13820.1 2-octaprenyl-6-methoxyphenyl hydroxylase [Idiomarina loihiensis]